MKTSISSDLISSDALRLSVALDMVHPNDNSEFFNGGVELVLLGLVSLRSGYRGYGLDQAEGGLALGAGLDLGLSQGLRLQVDYAVTSFGAGRMFINLRWASGYSTHRDGTYLHFHPGGCSVGLPSAKPHCPRDGPGMMDNWPPPTLLAGLLVGFLLWPASLQAGITGKLVGRVIRAGTEATLHGANVFLEGTTLGAATTEDGRFTLLQVPPGTYILHVSMIRFSDVRVEGVRIRIDLTTCIDVTVEPGVVGLQGITVVAQAPIVQRDITYSQVNIRPEEIANLPVEEFEDLLAVQAGVVVGASGGLHVRGGRSNELAYRIDGVPVTDPLFQSIAAVIETNAIQELQLISGTFNAECGQAMSGVVNIVTKDGSYERYSGSLRLDVGDYWSLDTAIYGQPVPRIRYQRPSRRAGVRHRSPAAAEWSRRRIPVGTYQQGREVPIR